MFAHKHIYKHYVNFVDGYVYMLLQFFSFFVSFLCFIHFIILTQADHTTFERTGGGTVECIDHNHTQITIYWQTA